MKRSSVISATVLSTGEIARALGISLQKTIKLLDSGGIPKMWKIPGSGFRRLNRVDLVSFMRSRADFKEKIERVLPVRILVYSEEEQFTVRLRKALDSSIVKVEHVPDSFLMGFELSLDRPVKAVVLDLRFYRRGSTALWRQVEEFQERSYRNFLLAVLPPGGQSERPHRLGRKLLCSNEHRLESRLLEELAA